MEEDDFSWDQYASAALEMPLTPGLYILIAFIIRAGSISASEDADTVSGTSNFSTTESLKLHMRSQQPSRGGCSYVIFYPLDGPIKCALDMSGQRHLASKFPPLPLAMSRSHITRSNIFALSFTMNKKLFIRDNYQIILILTYFLPVFQF